MIEYVKISDIGVIKEAELPLGPGLTVITGETGAGKTMALTSLQLLLGAKADSSKVRYGEENAQVEGLFSFPEGSSVHERILQAGAIVDTEEGRASTPVSRIVPSRGRSRAYMGAKAVPTAFLAEIASELVSVHGQNAHMRLAQPATQLAAIDAYAGSALLEPKNEWVAAFEAEKEARSALEVFNENVGEYARAKIAYEALVEKVEAVDPHEGEEEELTKKAHQLEHASELYQSLLRARSALEGGESENGAFSLLSIARQACEEASGIAEDEFLVEIGNRLQSLEVEMEDISSGLSHYVGNLDVDPASLHEVYARRQELKQLRSELAMDISSILAAYAQAKEALATSANPDEQREHLEEVLAQCEERAKKAARALTDVRMRAARELQEAINRELPALSLPNAHIEIRLIAAPARQSGCDHAEFLLIGFDGARPTPLATSASGGELSRIMLAVEVSLAAKQTRDSDHTFLFDEVDTGIGGRAATSVGKRLKALAAHAQVLVVTHLPQIAAFADNHAVIERSENENGITHVRIIHGEERVGELARMLSGSDTQAARAHAAELLTSSSVAP